jgi:hypothetical protein
VADSSDGDSQQHAHYAEGIAAPSRPLRGKAAQAQDEKYAGD